MANTKITALPSATNAEVTPDTLAYVVTDPSGTPTSHKAERDDLGLLPGSYLDLVSLHQTIGPPAAGNATIATLFNPVRVGQTCTGMEVFWRGTASVTLRLSLYDYSSGLRLAFAEVTTTGTPGVYTATFGTPVSLDSKKYYYAACYETSGSKYLSFDGQISITTTPLRFRDYGIEFTFASGAGDSYPVSQYYGYVIELAPLLEG
jgi:hypothetical protein